jgi:apolipoprotein N-acyltransferase
MSFAFMFLDVAPGPEVAAVGGVFAIAFFLLFLAVAFVAYKALKKVAKTGVRLAVVAVILLIAMVGSASLFIFSLAGSGGSQKSRPPANRTQR